LAFSVTYYIYVLKKKKEKEKERVNFWGEAEKKLAEEVLCGSLDIFYDLFLL
jgi:hypothetical protein